MVKKILGLSVALSLTVVLAGCDFFSKDTASPGAAEDDPAKVLLESWNRNADIKTSTTSLEVDFTVDADGAEAEGEIAATMAIDNEDSENPAIDASMSADIDSGDIGAVSITDFLFKVVDKVLYINIGGVEVTGAEIGIQTYLAMLEDYLDTWYMLDTQDEALQAMAEETVPTESDMSPEDLAKIQELIYEADLFGGISYDGEEKVGDVNCVKIKFDGLNPEGVVALLEALGQEFGGEDYTDPTDEDKEEITAALEMLGMTGTVWIGVEDGMIHKVDIAIAIEDEYSGSFEINLQALIKDINKPIEVEVPEDAKDLMEEIESLFSSMMGPSMLYDSSMLEGMESEYTDEEMQEMLDMLETMGM